jgi:hypothetical protein
MCTENPETAQARLRELMARDAEYVRRHFERAEHKLAEPSPHVNLEAVRNPYAAVTEHIFSTGFSR